MNRLAILTAALALLFTGSASAAVPDFLVKSPEDGLAGSGAGRMGEPPGIAADPNLPGNVYVVDRLNHRISVFTPWGEFVKAWGWGVKDGSSEFQICTAESGCQEGLTGGGAGQFKHPEAITIDSESNVYVIEGENRRVQKFDSAGNFLLMLGREVNQTTKANVCTKADLEGGDVCGAGVAGTGPGWLNAGFALYFSRLAINPLNNTIYVGEGERIQAFNPNGSFKEAIEGGCLAGKSLRAITTDSAGNLYAAFSSDTEIRKLKGSGPVAECAVAPVFKAESQPTALAPGVEGGLYVAVQGIGGEPQRVLEFSASGNCVNCGSYGEGGKSGFDRSSESDLRALATGSACGPTDVYVGHFSSEVAPPQSFINIFGPPPNPEDCPPPLAAPEITAQYALSVDTSSATLQAQINPNFWPDTTYYLEYGTSPCFEGGCGASPEPPGAILSSKTTKTPLKTAVLNLEGLSPGTTYHYRFVADSSGGGPTEGLSGKSGAEAEGTFITFEKPAIEPCPANEGFRSGPAALLPDCRAYELVSPLDKNNADIEVLPEFTTEMPSTLDQSSLDGNKLSYGSATAFGDAPSGAFTSQYIAARGKTEWRSHAINPARKENNVFASEVLDTELKALSPDLCKAWIRTVAEPPLSPQAPLGYSNIYRRTDQDCGGGPSWEALNTVKPPTLSGRRMGLSELQGRSADGEVAIFALRDSLTGTEAPPQPFAECNDSTEGATGCWWRLYLQQGGEGIPHFVCILPDGVPVVGPCMAGGPDNDDGRMRVSNYQGAISGDGSRVFWSDSTGSPAHIFMRENPAEPQSGLDGEGKCSEPQLACTTAVSEEAEELSGTNGSRFWAAAADGSKAIFTTGGDSSGDLYEFDVDTETTTLIAGKVRGVAGVSKDASRVYLVSEEACGDGGVAGERNLYLYEVGDECAAGEMAFVTVLGASDVEPNPINKSASSAVAVGPWQRSTRVTPSGLQLAFMSQGSPTGYDNTDRANGKADAEVFLYDATADGGEGKLACASCNPSGARPVGFNPREGNFWIASRIPVWENNLYAARVLSDDGSRLFFESKDALTPRDTNGAIDVYQWEAPGSGGCDESDPDYSTQNEGCVSPISSGKSKRDSKFMDASPSGEDVFFTTLSSLVSHDYGLVDVYDARVGGGLPPPPIPPPGCEGDSCQSPAAAPNDPTAASATFKGQGDPKPKSAKAKPRCAKGRKQVRKGGKARCVKKSAKRKRANTGRRAGR